MFTAINHRLHLEQMNVAALAEQYGTPLYLYSYTALKAAWEDFYSALKEQPHKICYAVKANANIAILSEFAKLGAGFDIVSIGELERVMAAGGIADNVIFSGVGKQANEIERALALGIYCFNVESSSELVRIDRIAGSMGKVAAIAIRVNPDVDAGTHPYISTGLKDNKFGVAIGDAFELYQTAASLPHLKIKGIAYHIGSQLVETRPFIDAFERVLLLVDRLLAQGIRLAHIDIGGGLGVTYQDERPPAPKDYLQPILDRLKAYSLSVIVEPGRALIANAGALITKVEYIKNTTDKSFAIVDAAMNDLLRPALYQAWHDIVPVHQNNAVNAAVYDVVGPVCETGDFLGKDRLLSISEGDLLAIKSTGAYGFTMSSNYNSRPRAAEVLVKDNRSYLIRHRETVAELMALENLVP